MTIQELINFGHRQLIQFNSARLDAELLLSDTIGKPVTYLLAHNERSVGFLHRLKYHRLIARRKKGVPVAYLRGQKEFYGLEFQVNRHVLVPRPVTEALVEAVLDFILPSDFLLDVGTGSGCIPIAILKHVKGLKAVGTDISKAALKVAAFNAKKHGVASRLDLFQSDLLQKVPARILRGRDLVVTANLPYVPRGFEVNIETKFEPQIALWAGEDGLEVYKKLLEQVLQFRPKAMFFECFDFQKAILAEHAPGYKLTQFKNPSGGVGILALELND